MANIINAQFKRRFGRIEAMNCVCLCEHIVFHVCFHSPWTWSMDRSIDSCRFFEMKKKTARNIRQSHALQTFLLNYLRRLLWSIHWKLWAIFMINLQYLPASRLNYQKLSSIFQPSYSDSIFRFLGNNQILYLPQRTYANISSPDRKSD